MEIRPRIEDFSHILRSQDRLGSRSLRCRSIARRCWNVIWGLMAPCRDVLAWSDGIPGVWSSAMAWPLDLAGGPDSGGSGGIAPKQSRFVVATASASHIADPWQRPMRWSAEGAKGDKAPGL